MIDWSRAQELRREIGEEGFAEVVDLFLDEVETTIGRLADAAGSEVLAADMHFLKGSAWNLGFVDFGALCHDGERRAATGGFGRSDLERIMESYAASKTAFLGDLEKNATSSAA